MRVLALSLLALAPLAAAPPALVRGIYCDPGPAVDNRIWAAYGLGYELDRTERHGGQASLKVTNTGMAEGRGGGQQIQLNQTEPRPIVVSGWAKLDGVTGPVDYHASVYLDLALRNGESWPMKIAAFDPAKPGWQYAEQIYTPPAPIASARVYVFLRERAGTAWFDDISVQEVLDAAGTRGPNLLTDPGFEGETPQGPRPRDLFYQQLTALNCNAFHFYRWVPWDKVMADPDGPLPAVSPDDPLLGFVRDAHQRGYGVWLTVGMGLPVLTGSDDPRFPFWPCVNSAWGQAYTRAVAYYAQYGFDGIGMVPDEWNYDTSPVSGLAKHADPKVAEFYQRIPALCDCDICHAEFRRRFGHDYPDVRQAWSTADPVWAELEQFRYDSTAAWIARSVAAAKQVKADIVTDTMICVLPVCSRDRLRTGAAWDQLGAETKLDVLQTDPYIQLHNYRGDSTHWYTTETTLHLGAANHPRGCGVTLEAAELREDARRKQPVEVYGSALSCLLHGAREFFWWHFNHVTGRVGYNDAPAAAAQSAAAYRVMRELEPALATAEVPGEVLVLYSRASEDAWDRLEHAKALPEGAPEIAKRGFYAHRNVLHWLLRRGVPFRMTFLDHPDERRLAEARVVLVPFPFSLTEDQAARLRSLAEAGKTVVLMSDLASHDRAGRRLPAPRLAALLGNRAAADDPAEPASAPLGRGRVVWCGASFADGLLQPIEPVKGPQAFVPVPPLDSARGAALTRVLDEALGYPASLFAEQPAGDVEVTVADGPRGWLLLATNWQLDQPATVRLRLPADRGQGWAIARDGSVSAVQVQAGDDMRLELAPQEVRLVSFSRRREGR